MDQLTYQQTDQSQADLQEVVGAFRDLSTAQIDALVRLYEKAQPVFGIALKAEFYQRRDSRASKVDASRLLA